MMLMGFTSPMRTRPRHLKAQKAGRFRKATWAAARAWFAMDSRVGLELRRASSGRTQSVFWCNAIVDAGHSCEFPVYPLDKKSRTQFLTQRAVHFATRMSDR